MTRLGIAVRAMHDARWLEIREVAQAQLALLRAQAMRWVRPLGDLVDVAPQPSLNGRVADFSQRETGERLALAINRATRYGVFRPRCLARAVALSQMLDGRGIHGHRIRIGVRRAGGTFSAHAWVELGDWVLGDSLWSTRSYAPLAEVCVVSARQPPGTARGSAFGGPRLPGGRSIWDQ